MGLVATRDIRVRAFSQHLQDYRGRRQPERRIRTRAQQLAELASALGHIGVAEQDPVMGETTGWEASFMRESWDRSLVEAAIVAGCHVFMTQDKEVLRARHGLEGLGIASMSPTDLVDELAASGELGQAAGPDGTVCDSHKWQHLERPTYLGSDRSDLPLSD